MPASGCHALRIACLQPTGLLSSEFTCNELSFVSQLCLTHCDHPLFECFLLEVSLLCIFTVTCATWFERVSTEAYVFPSESVRMVLDVEEEARTDKFLCRLDAAARVHLYLMLFYDFLRRTLMGIVGVRWGM